MIRHLMVTGKKLNISRCLVAVAAFFLLGSGCALAADIALTTTKRGTPALSLQGEIVTGDYQKLKSMYLKLELGTILYLDSPGGDLSEAMRMGQLIRLLQVQTTVEKDKVCASACFFIYLGGAGRSAAGAISGQPIPLGLSAGYLGLHRPFLAAPSGASESLERQSTAMKRVRVYLEGFLVSNRLIDLMMSRPSNDIYWLSDDDLEELGDYPPELEELYISRCGYNRKIFKMIYASKSSGNLEQTKNLQNSLKQTNICIAQFQQNAFELGMTKLRSGWRPS